LSVYEGQESGYRVYGDQDKAIYRSEDMVLGSINIGSESVSKKTVYIGQALLVMVVRTQDTMSIKVWEKVPMEDRTIEVKT